MSIIKITKAMCSPHSITISLSEPLIHYDSHYSPPAEIRHIKVLTLFTKLSSKSQLHFTNQNFSTILCFFWRFDSHRPNPPFRARFLLKWSELRWETEDRGGEGGGEEAVVLWDKAKASIRPATLVILMLVYNYCLHHWNKIMFSYVCAADMAPSLTSVKAALA